MGHDKSLHDGKKKREAVKSIKERRLEKKLKSEEQIHSRLKPRWKRAVEA